VAKMHSQLPNFGNRGQMQRVNIWQGASCKEIFYRGEKQNTPTLQGGVSYFTLYFIKYYITKTNTIIKYDWITV
jgi:hypothetical protein